MGAPIPIILIVIGVIVALVVSSALGGALVLVGVIWLLIDLVQSRSPGRGAVR